MVNSVVQFLVRWLGFCTALAALQACGALTQGKNETLGVQLQYPTEDSTFWVGVAHKTLKIDDGHGNVQNLDWEGGQSPSAEIRDGDEVEFQGTDDQGQVIVEGKATATGEKSLTIPLHRAV